ncbi:Acetyltransferase [Crenothrix polyspora]|uniref:Acetyltransferase n=1 Tax=Crenothrix polyspora TaxID=360316 RepID=A0A1R4H0Y0_9GAMM|nr:GNAT family N-acetyltransferase [Crenothrix polyspora]SJM89862.1 Acetyltransferase [Crenothrix polyspora]
MKVERLDNKKHNRKAFDCGIAELNLYLQQFANQDQKRGLARVYVLAEQDYIIGYYSISAHSIPADRLPSNRKLGVYQEVPFLLLGRLAIDKPYQGQGYGGNLIFHTFKTTIETAEKVGIQGIIVDAKDENAARFYQKFGFIPLSMTKNRLVLPFVAIKSLIKNEP